MLLAGDEEDEERTDWPCELATLRDEEGATCAGQLEDDDADDEDERGGKRDAHEADVPVHSSTTMRGDVCEREGE